MDHPARLYSLSTFTPTATALSCRGYRRWRRSGNGLLLLLFGLARCIYIYIYIWASLDCAFRRCDCRKFERQLRRCTGPLWRCPLRLRDSTSSVLESNGRNSVRTRSGTCAGRIPDEQATSRCSAPWKRHPPPRYPHPNELHHTACCSSWGLWRFSIRLAPILVHATTSADAIPPAQAVCNGQSDSQVSQHSHLWNGAPPLPCGMALLHMKAPPPTLRYPRLPISRP